MRGTLYGQASRGHATNKLFNLINTRIYSIKYISYHNIIKALIFNQERDIPPVEMVVCVKTYSRMKRLKDLITVSFGGRWSAHQPNGGTTMLNDVETLTTDEMAAACQICKKRLRYIFLKIVN